MEPDMLDDVPTLPATQGLGTVPVQMDYFSFGETFQVFLPDGVTYLEHKSINEGGRRRYLNASNKEVRLERGSNNAFMKMAAGDEKHILLEEAIVGWNVVRDGKPVTFSKGTPGSELSKFLNAIDPTIVDLIEKDVREHNTWLLAEVTVEAIDEEIERLVELRERKIKEDEGNSTSSAK